MSEKTEEPALFACDVNRIVWVRLNAYGVNILREAHVYHNGVRGPAFDLNNYAPPDVNGFSKWRLWELMLSFGGCLGLGLNAPWDGDMYFSTAGDLK